jgi:PAS domain S-box-containing protein
MPFSRHSLRAKILLPLLAVLIGALTFIAMEHAKSFNKDLTVRLQERAEHISSLVHFVGGSAPKPAELQRLVSALGGEPEVRLVIVAAGEPARVVASSEMAMLGKLPGELTNNEVREELQEATASGSRKFRFDRTAQDFDYFRPVSVSLNGPSGNELHRGAVLVRLDTHFLHEEVVQATTKAIATSIGTVVLLAAFCWLLLHRHVLQPVGQIGAAMAGFHAGDRSRLINGTRFSGELAQLAGAWNELVERLQREHTNRAEAEEAVVRSRDELEVRVAERTAELVRENEVRIHTEEELRWKTAFLEAQADSSLDGILVVDQHGKMLHRNRTLNEMWNVPKPIQDQEGDEALLTYIVSLNRHPQQFLERVKHLYAHPEEIGRDEIEFTDGRIMDRYSSPVSGTDGTYYGRIWTFRDITEQKEAEKALQRQRAELRVLFDLMPAMIWFKDTNNGTLRANQRAADAAGKSVAEMEGKSMYELYPQEAAQYFADDLEVIRSRAPKLGIVEKLRDKNGRAIWIRTDKVPYSNEDGEVIGIVVVAEDVTERRQAEQLQARFAATMNATTDFVGIADPEGHVLYINPAGRKMIGFDEQEDVTTTTVADHVAKAALDLMMNEAIPTSQREGVWSGESVFVSRDGREIPLSQVIVSHKGQDGEVEFMATTARDLTERKKSEAVLEQMHRELLETSRAAGMAEVATSVLHNVGNVLNSVNVSATLVSEGAKKSKASGLVRVVALLDEHAADLGAYVGGDPQGRKLPAFLRQLSEQLTREQQTAITELQSLRENIEHIKDIVAMQQSYGRVSGVVEVLQITDLVEDSLRMNGSALTRHGVRVVREYHEAPPIRVEKHKVLQILVNLIRNAKYACDEAGVEDKRITLRVEPSADTLRISVIDNGIGIPVENRTRIFNHGFTTRKDGHGFGLHSGALAATELGGSLSVHSDGPMTGATFTLELPLTASGTN